MREPTKSRSKEMQVGFFIFISLLVVAAFSFRITETPIFYSGTQVVTYLDDATGLFKKSKVKMAGIDVGLVTSIELEEGRAKITLTIQDGMAIPGNAQVVPRPLGILGDKYLEIVLPVNVNDQKPTDSETGAYFEFKKDSDQSRVLPLLWSWIMPSAHAQEQKLRDGDVLQAKNSSATVDDLARQMSDVTDDLKVISALLRQLLEGKDQNTPLGRTLKNTENLTGNLNSVVVENRQDLRQILKSLARVSKALDDVTNEEQQSGLGKDVQDLAKATNKLSKSVKHAESILKKIDEGEGTLGRLVNDPGTISEFNKALVTVNAALDRAERTQVFLEAVPEFNVQAQNTKTYIGIRLAPRDNTSYLGQIVVTPQGAITEKISTSTTNGVTTITTLEERDPAGFKFSLQYSKRIWNSGVRVGLFENTGGLALDQYFLKDKLLLTGELFDISSTSNLKFRASYRLFDIFLLTAGYEDALNDGFGFVGFGLSFSDEDLKTVLLFPGVP